MHKDLNKEINLLFRQLGKEVYEDSNIKLSLKQNKIKRKIQKKIESIETLRFSAVSVSSDAVILEPEADENGMMLFVFCKNCKAGNHPNSSHCIRCGQAL
ncbi:MAG: hypothetical protein JW708_11920 [Vallitaleaceae bacterium]|nr:hypothetical protein [Vallitaleaceae bacterium]